MTFAAACKAALEPMVFILLRQFFAVGKNLNKQRSACQYQIRAFRPALNPFEILR